MSTTCKPSDISRFWFDGASGIARHDGVTVDLTVLPRIQGMPEHLRAIDYCPATRVAMVRESGQAWREMDLRECAAARGFLLLIAAVVREVLA